MMNQRGSALNNGQHMIEISFYHLSSSPLDKALAKLLEKVIAAGKRAVVLADTPEKVAALDTALWTYASGSFLPHGTCIDGQAEYQPIYLTTTLENPNGATFLVVVDGMKVHDFMNFERCFDIFNGLNQTSVAEAHERWHTYKNQGHQLTYWFQDQKGVWHKKDEDNENQIR
jgi:DNA polymerase-3 subunit chi